LRIDWVEQGGPPVTEPRQRGFGSKLIEGSIASELGGRATLTFAPDGLRCGIVLPLKAATIEVDINSTDEDWSI
jgi:two-component sensor histidine kinase